MPIGNNIFPRGSGSGGGGGNIQVTVATTANINLASAPSTIDGYSLALNDKILVKNQTPDTGTGNPDNGIYLWNGTSNPITRLTGFISWGAFIGIIVHVEFGDTYNDSNWDNNATVGGTLGTTNLKFEEVSVLYNFTGGITETGNNVTLTTVAPVANKFFNSVDSNGNLVLTSIPSAPFPANYAIVAENGIDGTLMNATINGALTAVSASSDAIIELYVNNSTGYDMPTQSLNNRKIMGVDQASSTSAVNFCDIVANSNTLPIANNDQISIVNARFVPTVSYPNPIMINNITGIYLLLQNVQNPNMIISGVCSGNIYLENYTGTITLTGSASPFLNIYIKKHCDITINNTSTVASQYFFYVSNSTISGGSTSGYWDVQKSRFFGNFVFSGSTADFVQLDNCSTLKGIPFDEFYKLTTSGNVYARIANCDTNHNANVYNSNTLITITDNKVINLASNTNPTYNLTFADSILNVNCSTGQMTINLPTLSSLNFSSSFLNKHFLFNKLDPSTNKLTFVANGADLIYKGGSSTNSVDYTGATNITLSINYINGVNVWTSA